MVYGAIDLHARYSQIRIVDAEGRVVRERRVVTSRERLVAVFVAMGAADSARDGNGERVGGAGARRGWPRGDRGRSELRADVRRDPAEGQNRSAGRDGAGGGQSAWLVSRRPIACRRPSARCARCYAARRQLVPMRQRNDLVDPRLAAARRVSAGERQRRAGAGSARDAGSARGPGRDADAVTSDGRGADRRNRRRRCAGYRPTAPRIRWCSGCRVCLGSVRSWR